MADRRVMRAAGDRQVAAGVLGLVLVLACHRGEVRSSLGETCQSIDDCRGGLSCVAGRCQVVDLDGGFDGAGAADGPSPAGDGAGGAGAGDAGPSGDVPPAVEMACAGPAPPPITCSTRTWPSGIIPYELSPELAAWEPELLTIMEQWSAYSAGRMGFAPRQNETDYIILQLGDSCEAECPYGNRGGPQAVAIASLDCAAHRLGHVVGLGHPHQRFDRDQHLSINRASPECRDDELWPIHQFSEDCADCFGEYDLWSVMHAQSRGERCTQDTPEECQFSSKFFGARLSVTTGPTVYDAAKALELYATEYGNWARSRSLGLEVSAEQPVSDSFSPSSRIGASGRPAPAATWKDAQHLYLFALGYDNAIWYRVLDQSTGVDVWSTWSSLGGTFGGPAAATYDGSPYVCALADTGVVRCRSEISVGHWTDWWDVSGVVGCNGPPGMAANASGMMALLCVGTDRRFWFSTFDGSFRTWSSLPLPEAAVGPEFETFATAFTTSGQSSADLHGFIRETGGTGSIWHCVVNGPTGCSGVLGHSSVRPAAVADVNTIWLFGPTTYSSAAPPVLLQLRYIDRAWYFPPRIVGGNLTSGLGAALRPGDERIDLFTVGGDGAMWHRWRLRD